MSKAKSKMKRQGGFTLIEMLIVVAIIAILVAVSIPLINSSLERSRIATDAANERAAKAEILIAYLTEGYFGGGINVAKDTVYVYDAANGKILRPSADSTAVNKIKGYGKCVTMKHNAENMILYVGLDKNEEVYMQWSPKGTKPEFDSMKANTQIHGGSVE